MKRYALASVVLSVAVLVVPGAGRAQTHQVKLNGHTFTVPAGFDIELAAGPPLANRPIVADFDEQGRLYVADSSGSNDPVQVQLQKKPHRILRLEDTDGDGRFDHCTVFADRMMFPEGCRWLAGSLYVSAAPSIWKLTDTDGDGVADQRGEWFRGKTLTGCANDLHGPYRGPDGWVYWCKGAFARQSYERPGKRPFVTRAAHVFRSRPDGSGIEPVLTGGMDNPVAVVFTPGGERILTTTFFQHPGGGRRDGLIHAVYGGIYGKDHDVIYDSAHQWTGPSLMPVLAHLGPAAPCGLTRYESRAFGPEYQDNLFACLFNLHKVTRHVLEPDGATFKTRDEDFLVSDNVDFHPTDVLEDADGGLLVLDTGGWYKLCCPTSQLHKPDVLGAIYRVRRTNAPRVEDPRGLKLAWANMPPAELARLLDDPRSAVRRRAVETLGTRGATALPVLTKVIYQNKSGERLRNALWAATRIDSQDARAAVRRALEQGGDETTQQVAIHSASLWRDAGAVRAGLLDLLQGKSAQNRRAAAEALGRIGDPAAVPAVLEVVGRPRGAAPGSAADRVLEHSLTYALIQIDDPKGTGAGLRSGNVLTRRAALTALDQMDGGRLEAAAVAADLAAPDPRLRETAWWIAGRHPEWGGALAGFLGARPAAPNLSAGERDELVDRLARFAGAAPVQDLLAERLRDPRAPREVRRTALRAVARAGLKEAPGAWLDAVTAVLAGDDGEEVREAVTAARALHVPKKLAGPLTAGLLRCGDSDRFPVGVRLAALAAVPGGLAPASEPRFAFLREHLGPDEPVAVRSAAADVLSRAHLSAAQLGALTESLKAVGPMELDRLLEAYAGSSDEAVGLALVAALKASPSARAGLRVEMVKPRLAKYGAKVRQRAEELYALLDADAARQRARLEGLLGTLKGGDVRRGQAVFNSQKAACSSCHAIGYLGGNVGPDLTHVGAIRTERDLLEAIVLPSASFVRSYEPVQVTTRSGKVYNGVLKKDAPDEVELATNATERVRLARDEIEDVQPSKVSIMPAGLDQQLTPRDLADLVAFLKACK
jgi:putative membrane-bound dehydrogenase-like protein